MPAEPWGLYRGIWGFSERKQRDELKLLRMWPGTLEASFFDKLPSPAAF